MTARDEAERFLRSLADSADADIPIGEAALALALLDMPEADPAPYRDHLAALIADTGAAAGASADLRAQIEALNGTILGRHGYAGDRESYDDLANANLVRVIERKRGLPVALGILYIHAARAQGWQIAGLNFPGHFVVGITDASQGAILDPFHGGRLCDEAALSALIGQPVRPEYLSPVGTRDVLIRLQNNLKSRHQQAGRYTAALKTIESMLMFAPERDDLREEHARLRTRLN